MSSRPFLLGLTGSMAMGKSTTAAMFRAEGIPVWDADEAVSRIYRPNGAGAERLAKAFGTGVLREDGSVDRSALRRRMVSDPDFLVELELIVHPLVENDRELFVLTMTNEGSELVVLDIPLLFEKGLDERVDAVVVVTAPADEQKRRVLARGKITEAEFDAMFARQMPDRAKRQRADFVIHSTSCENARSGVKKIIANIKSRRIQS